MKSTAKIDIIFFLIISILILNFSQVEAVESKEIVRAAMAKQNLNRGSYILHMDAIATQEVEGEVEESTSSLKIYLYNGGERQMATFTEPEDLVDNRFLVIGTNVWMSTRDLRRPIRVSGSQRIFGDAGIGETVGIDYYSDYEVEEFYEKDTVYIMDLVAKEGSNAYQRIELTIAKDTNRIKKVILKALSGTPLKELTYRNYKKIGEHQIADIVIRNLLQDRDRVTELSYTEIEKSDMSASIFQPTLMNRFELMIND